MSSLPLKSILGKLRQIAPNVKGLTSVRLSIIEADPDRESVTTFDIDGETYEVMMFTQFQGKRRAVIRTAEGTAYKF